MTDQRFVPTPRSTGGATGRRGGDSGSQRRARARRGGRPVRNSGQPLADLLDRLVDTGAVVSGDVVVALAGVDLLRVDLRLLLVGVQTALEGRGLEGVTGEARP